MIRRARTYLYPLVRKTHDTTTPFVIISGIRTGSHLLRSLLNSHPDIACLDELLQIRTVDPLRLVRNAMAARAEPAVGFLAKPNHVSLVQRVGLDGWINWMTNEGFRCIHIVRRDVLKQALSIHFARAHRIWAQTTGRAKTVESMRIEPADIESYLAYLKFWKQVEDRFASGFDVVRLVYEDELRDSQRHQSSADRVFRHLGLEPHPVKTDLRKILPDDPRVFVENWDEIVERFGAVTMDGT